MNETAKEQFVNDYTIVIDNDREAYEEVMEIVREESSKEYSTGYVAQRLESQFEKLVDDIAYNAGETYGEASGLLIRQMLSGWGSDTWYTIASHYEKMFEESVA